MNSSDIGQEALITDEAIQLSLMNLVWFFQIILIDKAIYTLADPPERLSR